MANTEAPRYTSPFDHLLKGLDRGMSELRSVVTAPAFRERLIGWNFIEELQQLPTSIRRVFSNEQPNNLLYRAALTTAGFGAAYGVTYAVKADLSSSNSLIRSVVELVGRIH